MQIESKVGIGVGALVAMGFMTAGAGVAAYFAVRRFQLFKAQRLYLEQISNGKAVLDLARYTQMTTDIARFKKLEWGTSLVSFVAGLALGAGTFGCVCGIGHGIRAMSKGEAS